MCRRQNHHLLPIALGICLAFAGAFARAGPDPDKVRAAMIYNLTKFVDWPHQGTVLNICIVGKDALFRHIYQLDGKRTNGRKIVIRRDARASVCQVLVYGYRAPQLTSQPGVLTIGRSAGFLDSGGIVALRLDQDRVVFDVNLAAAKAQGLVISSEILELARSVR